MKRIFAVSLLLTLLLVQAWRARPRALQWAPDFARALALAPEDDAWVVVHLRQPSRPLGARMDLETLTARLVELAARDGFVHVKLNAEVEPQLASLLAGPGAALSTLVVVPVVPVGAGGEFGGALTTGEVIARRDGFLEASELARFLDDVRERRPTLERQQRRLADAPDDIEARIARAEVLGELGASGPAEEELRIALARGERSTSNDRPATMKRRLLARAHERLAYLLAERGQAALAREELAHFDRLFAGPVAAASSTDAPPPEWADAAVITEARLQWLERRKEDALVMLDALLARYPPSPCAAEAQALRAKWRRK